MNGNDEEDEGSSETFQEFISDLSEEEYNFQGNGKGWVDFGERNKIFEIKEMKEEETN